MRTCPCPCPCTCYMCMCMYMDMHMYMYVQETPKTTNCAIHGIRSCPYVRPRLNSVPASWCGASSRGSQPLCATCNRCHTDYATWKQEAGPITRRHDGIHSKEGPTSALVGAARLLSRRALEENVESTRTLLSLLASPADWSADRHSLSDAIVRPVGAARARPRDRRRAGGDGAG